ncbi:glycosyl hydrolase family 28-related protein [Rhodalgimonas zhirmunskyi]|uniref:Right-handed parallel beta-helix repeat-containing protein n=1 Tax=Rhodalgimonas zhirmunskyi TaxID=2964767 RepID=A0AAJ1UBF6_9RHOB|nr:glycosyl hydrolase family 28-related protein [Rhodoalgimonas zhirmunskyi]MDQ2093491.1 right-handed parallel beta-helix repeat-containing protein [Rhodoalgimonas zhirmunskyi]
MSVEITEGVTLMPPPFADGLNVWSSGDGTPGSDTYASAANAAFVPADQDFSGCLEVQKTASTQKIRYMGETPLLPGVYLRVTARVKAISGNLPSVRIAGWAGAAGGGHVSGVEETGPSTTLSQYGEVVEVSAIVGVGNRTGVDMVWGAEPIYGHFGIDLTGQTGGVVRVDDIVIEDVTNVFLRTMMGTIDVRDYGAIGDGITDDRAAFEAADAAAAGRTVIVSDGEYYLGDDMTFESEVQFEGTVTMPVDAIFVLRRNFHLPAYIDAFGDEELAFKKAFQALLDNADHESLDMGGRIVNLTGPIDMQAAVANRTTYATRRVIANGQFSAEDTPAWDEDVVTSQASYSASNNKVLSGVENAANIPVGALVEGNGVGREVYVRAVNVGAQQITLSDELYDAEGTQTFTFRRFKYMLDFSGFADLDKMTIRDVEFNCRGRASGVMLATAGLIFQVRDCYFTKPKDRGLTSPGEGSQGLLVDRCQFLSNEGDDVATSRTSIALNVNANDAKIRNNRATRFRHFAVISGSGAIVTGNHFFQGDNVDGGARTAGIVLGKTSLRVIFNSNYVDNCFLEWTNELDSDPDQSSEFSFSQLNITDNTFYCTHAASWFSFIVVKPLGTGHFLNGMVVQGNTFRAVGVVLDRVDRVDTSFADLDWGRTKNVTFSDNMFNNITTAVSNPLVKTHVEASTAQSWIVDCAPNLPFGGWARNVESVQAIGAIRTDANVSSHQMPYVKLEEGSNNDQVELVWDRPVRGEVMIRVRMDTPI